MGYARKNSNKHFFRIVLFLLSLSLVGCTAKLNSFSYESGNILPELLTINTKGIVEQIERSKMSDFGYRFANAEYSSQISSFATYYIREAQKNSGLISIDDYITMTPDFLRKFENESAMDLTDIFTTVMLVNDLEGISDLAKENISKYFDSLYDDRIGCYRLPNSNNSEIYAENVYPTFLVEQVAALLNLKTKSVDKWLKEASTELLQPNTITRKNSSAYVMMMKLMQSHHIELSKISSDMVKTMFENDLDNIAELIKSNEVYLPIYLMDYLDFSLLLNIDSSDYHDLIIDSITDENEIKDGVIQAYDPLGLYAAIYSLKLAGYDFKTSPNFSDVFDVYNSFLLDESTYITPGYTESNFVDTYFVDAITNVLEIESPNSIDLYLYEKRDDILQSDPIVINNFLELLQKHNLLHIIDNKKQELVDGLFSSMDDILAKETLTAKKLPYVNAIIRALEILERNWSFSKTQVDEMIDSFTEIDNVPQNTMNLIELATFINLINPDRDEIKPLCNEIISNIVHLNDLDLSNKLHVQSKALNLLQDLDYKIPNNVIKIVGDTLINAQHTSGLFKGGDATEDVVSFRSTYDALFLQKVIYQK
ncbi:hypothetical protein [Paenibacillus sp. B1-33]|uniref:hypothetical protein n=1 Tax=unclassified Paenibacillus TaxID=185978 RepID=UPI003D2D6CC8